MPNDTCPDDVAAFMVSGEGQRFLEGIRAYLQGQTIREVHFQNHEGEGISTLLLLGNGQEFAFDDRELWLETLRGQFSGLFRELAQHGKEKDQ